MADEAACKERLAEIRLKTTITNAKLIPEDRFDVNIGAGVLFARKERPRGYGLVTFLYENEAETGPLLKIPERFTDDE